MSPSVVPHLRRVRRRLSDAKLSVRILWFICRAPADMERHDLPTFLARIRGASRPRAVDPWRGHARIARLRGPWLRRPLLRRRNTCYVRALTLYRFLDPGEHTIGIHFGIEPPRAPGDRLHGHAWVTVDGAVLEGPPELVAGRVQEVTLDEDR